MARSSIRETTRMGMDHLEAVRKMEQLDYIQILYKRAWPGEELPMKDNLLLGTLWLFNLTMRTNDSKFDRNFVRLVPSGVRLRKSEILVEFDSFTESENLGKNLFLTNCGSCHGAYLGHAIAYNFNKLTDHFANNGLDVIYSDKGRGELFNAEEYWGQFKVPPLRNIEVTAPYMHDGRFETLEDVVDFYSTGIQAHPNLHPILRDSLGNPRRFNFTEIEKTAIVDFLKTLTDTTVLNDPKWGDPFIR